MQRKKINTIVKTALILGMVSASPFLSKGITANASGNLEEEFLSTINKFNEKDLVVENGISLREGETLDLSKNPNWTLSNNDTVSIKKGIVTPKNEGTVYLSQKIGDKAYVFELYVPSKTTEYSMERATSVNRNYYKVFIDPGHGGHDNGASGNGIYEDEINLQVSKRLKQKLMDRGIQVKMSRETDTFLSLSERARMANQWGADVFVSKHVNSATNTSATGMETFHHVNKTSHKPLSTNIQNNVINATGMTNRGVKSANFAVLRESNMPSTLFENGFISNKSDASKIRTAEHQEKVANAMADAIEKYLKDNIKLSNGTGGSTSQEQTYKATGTITASALNVRSGYGTSYSTIGSLKNGTKVDIVAKKGDWYKIKFNSGYGYISGDYVKISSTSNPTPPPPKPETVIKTGTVTASTLNVRSSASTSASILGGLSNGAKVEIVSTSSGWHKIKYKNGYGYVSTDYIKLTPTSTPAPTPTPPKPETVIKTGTVTASALNVRSSASTSSSVIGSLSKGAKVEIVSTSNGWHKIKHKSGYGYVSTDYIKLTPTSTPTPPKPQETVKIGIITASSLNVRSSASTNSSVLGSLSKGAKIEVVSTSNGWHKIKYKNGYAYVSSNYVSFNTSTVKTGTITASSLNVRSGASTRYSVIGSLSKGAKVEIVSTSNGWHKIKYKNGYGYVSTDYVK